MPATKDLRTPLPEEETNQLVKKCRTDKERFVIIGLLDTGMRITELLSIKSDNCYFERKILVFPSLKTRTHQLRQVPLTNRFGSLLKKFFKDDGRVPKMTVATADLIIKRVAQRAGISRYICPHSLRHTYAVNSLCNGIDVRTLQRRLGHANLTTTSLYLRWVPDKG